MSVKSVLVGNKDKWIKEIKKKFSEFAKLAPRNITLPKPQNHVFTKIACRAVFNRVLKVIRVLLFFCFTSLCNWLKNLAPLSRPIRSISKTNRETNRDLLARTRFPALGTRYMYLLQVLIGSLGNLCLL